MDAHRTFTLLFLLIAPVHVHTQRKLTGFDCTESECIADLNLRKKNRLLYPGACSLDYQNAMQVVTECLFCWDSKKQQGQQGILGVLEAFCRADEEQGRGTLHSHWLIWIKKFNLLRKMIWNSNACTRQRAQQRYIDYINEVMSAKYGDFEVVAKHTCKNGKMVRNYVRDTHENCEDQVLRDARHKSACYKIAGQVLKCKTCGDKTTTRDLANNALCCLKEDLQANDIDLPLSASLLDIAAYRHVYDLNVGSKSSHQLSNFWSNPKVRQILLRLRFDEHLWSHVMTCFKKGCECRFLFPFLAGILKTTIFPDEQNVITWHLLDGTLRRENRYMIQLQRPQGCQYINTHSVEVSNILNCNTNVQTGDSGQAFYQTLYAPKNTQKDDSKPRDLVAKQVVRRLLRVQDEARKNSTSGDDNVRDWIEGLSLLLSGINAATSRSTVSAPIAHNLVLQLGQRFVFSHDFVELLVGQLEDVMNNRDVGFICRTCFLTDGTTTQWADVSANDYMYRPDELEDTSFYEQTMNYKKGYKKKCARDKH